MREGASTAEISALSSFSSAPTRGWAISDESLGSATKPVGDDADGNWRGDCPEDFGSGAVVEDDRRMSTRARVDLEYLATGPCGTLNPDHDLRRNRVHDPPPENVV